MEKKDQNMGAFTALRPYRPIYRLGINWRAMLKVGIGSFQNGNFPFWKLTGNFLKLSKPNFGGSEISSGQRKFPDFALVYCDTAHHQVYQYTALLSKT